MAKKPGLNLNRQQNNYSSQKTKYGVDPLTAVSTIAKIRSSAGSPTSSVVRKPVVQQNKPVVTPKKTVVTPKKITTSGAKTSTSTSTSASQQTPTKSYVQNLYESTIGAKAPNYAVEAAQKKAEWNQSINDQVNALLTSKNADDRQFAQQLESGRKALENSQFQQYQQALQSMANRGLSNSGIAQDVNARMQMAGNQQLNNLIQSSNNNQMKVDQQYQQQVNELYKNRDKMTTGEFEKQLKDAWDETQQKQYELGLKAAPYYQMTAAQQAANSLGYTNALGYMIDPATGQPIYSGGQMIATLGRDKLSASVANNQAALGAKYARIQADVDMATAKLKNTNASTATKNAIDIYKNQLGSITKQMNTYVNRGMDVPKELTTAYDNANANLYNIIDNV